jgi:hypothetical protein
MDDDLRALEHRVAAAPTAQSRLALARGLERVGRRDDAHVVLAQDPFDADVRAALARYPAWTQADGDPGRTRWLDVPPIEREPAVRWRVELGHLELIEVAAVTPWGIVVVAHDPPRHERALLVLDPRSGAVRHLSHETVEVLGVVSGALLLSSHGLGAARTLVAFDLATLADAWRLDLGVNPSPAYAHGSLVVGGDAAERPLALVALTDPFTPPTLPPAWPGIGLAAMTPERAYVTAQRRLRDRRSFVVRLAEGTVQGVEPWGGALGSFRADTQGVLVTGLFDPIEVTLHDPDGARLWRRADFPSGRDAVLGPRHVVMSWRGRDAHVVRREAGQPSTLLPMKTTSVTAARDWVYACSGPTLVGARADGAATWTHDLGAGDLLTAAPAWGRRVVVLGDAGVVVCLEQP